MTEDEAKQKWCPFAGGRPERTDSKLKNCLGKDCMAWRIGDIEENPNGQHPHTWDDTRPFHDADTKRRFIRHGYCGLAGKP